MKRSDGIAIAALLLLAHALLALGEWRGLRFHLPAWTTRVPAYAIGSVAVFWCCERAATFWAR